MGVCFLYFLPQETLSLLGQVSGAFLDSRRYGTGSEIFLSSFLAVFWYVGLFFLLGYLRGGKWLTLFLLWFRGLGSGLSMAGIYYESGRSALPVMAGVAVPVAFCQALLLFGAAKAVWSFRQSVRQGKASKPEAKIYLTSFVQLALLTAACAALDAVLSVCWM